MMIKRHAPRATSPNVRVQNDNLVWKDSVLVPTGREIEILVDITNPGKWMAHCHIAEHLESGMMLVFEVDFE